MLATLHHTIPEADHITTFWFKPERPLRHVAGQFVELTLPHDSPDDRGIKRWFTVSSAPGHELVSITTKQSEPSSSFKTALWTMEVGDSLEMSEPMGDFVLPKDPTKPLVFVAGGIGITPFHAIIQWLLDTKQMRPIQLIYAVSRQEEIVFRKFLRQPFITLQLLIRQSALTTKEIIELVEGIDGKQIFISGPEPMTETIVDQFKQLGITQDQLITDYFPGYQSV